MANAMSHIGTVTLTSALSTVSFTNIPGEYRDLYLVAQTNNSGTSSASRLRLNGATTGYYGVWMVGQGSSSGSGSESNETGARIMGASVGPSGGKNTLILNVMDYSATDKQKTILSRFSDAGSDVQATASRWDSTAVVTSLTIYDVLGQTYQVGNTFTLYGVIS